MRGSIMGKGVEKSAANGHVVVMARGDDITTPAPVVLPLVVAIHCLEDCRLEKDALAGIAEFRHVGLAHLPAGRVEEAVAVVVRSLVHLPVAAQRRLKPWQLILSLSCADKAADTALASELGLQLIHVDKQRVEEVADTTLAFMLGLLRHTHILAKKSFAPTAAGWLGPAHSVCKGMRRCKDLVVGIVGTSATAVAVAVRSLAFRMIVVYFDPENGGGGAAAATRRRKLPVAAKEVETLGELLAISDVVTLHCAITSDTVQLINEEALHSMKRGQHSSFILGASRSCLRVLENGLSLTGESFGCLEEGVRLDSSYLRVLLAVDNAGAILINTSSSHLIDDCALKQAIIDGTVAGCALDGAESPHWIEAWVREMPNVLITSRSADYSEEAWMEIRAKAMDILCSYLVVSLIPTDVTSEDDEYYTAFSEELPKESFGKDIVKPEEGSQAQQAGRESTSGSEYRQKQVIFEAQDSPVLDSPAHQQQSRNSNEARGSGKKGRRRSGRRKAASHQSLDAHAQDPASSLDWVTVSQNGQRALNSEPRFASPDQGDVQPKPSDEPASLGRGQLTTGLAIDQLKEGYVVALHCMSGGGFYVARQRGPGRGWVLDVMSDVTPEDPASQFLLVVRNRDRIGLRSFAAGGKLLQANKKLELVFVNHAFDVWEGWFVEGRTIQNCNLTNSRFRSVSLHVSMRILAAVGEEDGVARWIH